jgi:hypothetical protein
MNLQVLQGGSGDVVEAFTLAPFDFARQPLRPGVAHEPLCLAFDPALMKLIERTAALEGMPAEQWAAIAIESERVLRIAAEATGRPTIQLEQGLAAAAVRSNAPAISHQGRRLSGYARALRRLGPRGQVDLAGQLRLPVPYHSLLAWELESIEASVPLGEWIADLLCGPPKGRVVWEAAAAEAGELLGSWVVLQAARLASC